MVVVILKTIEPVKICHLSDGMRFELFDAVDFVFVGGAVIRQDFIGHSVALEVLETEEKLFSFSDM